MIMKMDSSTRRQGNHTGAVVTLALAATLGLLGGGAAHAAAPSGTAPPAPAPLASPAVGAAAVPAPGYSVGSLLADADAALAAGRSGVAIVALERARLLAPRSAVVASHLAHAREVANLPPAQTGRVMRVARLLSDREWSRMSLGGLALGAAGVILLAWGAKGRKRAAGLVAAGLAFAALGLIAAAEVTPSRGEAVVVSDGTARIAPFPEAEPAFAAPEGAPVTVVRAHGDYVLVSASEGQGWLSRASVETILPRNPHRP